MDKKTLSFMRGYLEKSRQKLRSAEILLREGSHEDAVSRAYYCAFHAAQAVLLSEGLTADTHQGLVNLFGLHLVKPGRMDKRFGKFLANLKDDCENSDYEIFSAVDEEAARQAVGEAKKFLAHMEKYLRKRVGRI